MKCFEEIEGDFVRQKVLPDFEWEWFDHPSQINPLHVPVSEGSVAIVSTAGAYVKGEQPAFERGKDGDASFREIPSDVPMAAFGLSHIGYDTRRALQDPNVVIPIDRLREAEQAGNIGSIGPRHFSFMGYSPHAKPLMENASEVGSRLLADAVNLVLLVPA